MLSNSNAILEEKLAQKVKEITGKFYPLRQEMEELRESED
jgi:hypothetical protein